MHPPTPYVADAPAPTDREALRNRIPGWGADLDPADRPSVPRLRPPAPQEGVHWTFPDRQEERWPRERSIEHEILPPVFGTACPPRGPAGVVRRFAFRYSEARAGHWLLLLLADRVDAWEHHLRSFASLRPDNPVTGSGLRSELTHHGIRSRRGRRRADVAHHALDPLIVGGPWIAGLYVAWRIVHRVRSSLLARGSLVRGARSG